MNTKKTKTFFIGRTTINLACESLPPSETYRLWKVTKILIQHDGVHQQFSSRDTIKQAFKTKRHLIAVPPAQPEIQDHPNGSVVKVPHEQETINFTCTCSNGKPAATITWLRNDEPVVDYIQNFTSVLDNKLENAKSILTVHPQHEDNGAIYTCRASNDAIRKPLDAIVVLSVMRECDIIIVFIYAYPSPDVTALMDLLYISRSFAVRPTLQTLAHFVFISFIIIVPFARRIA